MPLLEEYRLSREIPAGRTQVDIGLLENFIEPDIREVRIMFTRNNKSVRAVVNLKELDELITVLSYYRKRIVDEAQKDQTG